MERSLTQISQGITEDEAAIKRFMEDVLRMKTDLVSLTRLIVEEKPHLILPHWKVLSDIKTSLTSLSIPCDDLTELIPDSTTSEDSNVIYDTVDEKDALEQNSDEAVMEEVSSPDNVASPSLPDTVPTANEANVTSAATIPKFNWASKAVVQKAEVKSFLQIQEEEKNVKSS